MNEEFKTDKIQEYITKMRHNPVGLIEESLGYKLNFFEKSYFRFQLLFRKKYNDEYNFLWLLSIIWSRLD